MDIMRGVKILAIIAALSVGLMLFVTLTQERVNRADVPPKLIDELALDKVARLEVTHGLGLSGERVFNFRRSGGQWFLAERHNYPAHQELVNETLLALADIELLEARTANPDWHRLLGLVAPENIGKAIRFRLYDGAGDELASILLGRSQQSEAENVQDVQNFSQISDYFYIRKEGDAQSWLANGRLPRSPERAAWLSPHLPRPDRAALAYLTINNNKEKMRFDMREETAKIWLDQFYALRPDEIAPRSDIDFEAGKSFTLSTISGLTIDFEVVGVATTVWLAARAEYINPKNIPDNGDNGDDADNGEATSAAELINARFANWAYRFPASAAPILFPEAVYFNHALSDQ